MTVVYSENKASLDDLRGLLYKTTNYFSPPLHSTVNISDYAKKMRKFAYTSEAWCSSLIGIVSCYLNNYVTYEGFITYVCVLRKFQRKHIVSNLMSMLFKKAYEMSFFNISLEVSKVNEGAILLYKQNGFVIANTTETVYTMKKLLSTPPPPHTMSILHR